MNCTLSISPYNYTQCNSTWTCLLTFGVYSILLVYQTDDNTQIIILSFRLYNKDKFSCISLIKVLLFLIFKVHMQRLIQKNGYTFDIVIVTLGLDMRNLQYEIRICQKIILKSQWQCQKCNYFFNQSLLSVKLFRVMDAEKYNKDGVRFYNQDRG